MAQVISPRGSKRTHPVTPEKNPKPGSEAVEDSDMEVPKVLHADNLSKLEREKVRRIVSPKKGSGNLEVPENIFEMWKDAGKGRESIFKMWAKSGGVKVGGICVMCTHIHMHHA